MWSPNELLKIEKQRDILSYITLQFFHFKKVPLEHCPFCVVLFLLVENTGPILITVTLLQSMHGALLGELSPHSFGLNEKSTTRFRVVLSFWWRLPGSNR